MIKENFIKLYENSFRENWDLPCYTDYGENTQYTYGQVAEEIARLHLLFKHCSLRRGDKISVIGKNNAHWCIAYMATITYGAIIVPILQDFTPNDVHHIVNHSESVFLFISDNIWENLEEEKLMGLRGDRTRFFLKVQDGCDYFCSYCTIPFARGRSRNGTIASMVEQARQAAAEGGKEIVLTGVNIGDFGKTTGETFFDLVQALDQIEGIERYRISSIEPNLLTDEIIEFVSHSRSFMPHFHIPLQSGCDEVLKLMRRRYDTALFASKVKKIKEVMPDAFIGVDVIVGTRGETAEFFEQAYRFISGLDVTQLHVFSYSERPGTQALKIDHVVSPEEKHQRSQRLLALSDEKTQAFYARHIGQTMSVLLEKSKGSTPMHGFTKNYIRIEVESDNSLDNQVVNVRLGDFNEDKTALKGTILI